MGGQGTGPEVDMGPLVDTGPLAGSGPAGRADCGAGPALGRGDPGAPGSPCAWALRNAPTGPGSTGDAGLWRGAAG